MASKVKLPGLASTPTPTRRLRACSVCVRQGPSGRNEMLLVSLHDKVSNRVFLTPPGGGIEHGEAAVEAAIRETFEETGFLVRAIAGLAPITVRYDFIWEGSLYDCSTSFYACELIDPLKDPATVNDAYYNRGATWVPVEEVFAQLSFMPIPRDAIIELLRPWLEKAR